MYSIKSQMILPDYLKPEDKICFVSPSGKIKPEKVKLACHLLEKEKLRVSVGENAFEQHFQFAGTDNQRLKDLQQALDDPDCKAIFCTRGGYGAIRIAAQINFNKFLKHPKWLVGFSDITVLHALLQKEKVCSIHGAMCAYYYEENKPSISFNELLKTLKGEKRPIILPSVPENKTGDAKGSLVGGNLSILYSLLGTPFEIKTEGKILFIEDLSEYLYHIDRMIYSLKLSGKLKNLAGLIVGQMTDLKDNRSPFGQNVREIILNAVKEYDYPVCFNFPAGHVKLNLPLKLGAEHSLSITSKKVIFREI